MIDDAQVEETTVAEETAEAPSAENQTEETTQEETQADSTQGKTVPYDRFSQVVKTKQQLEARVKEMEAQLQTPKMQNPSNPEEEAVKQQLEKYLADLGYVKKAELDQKEADRQLEENIKSLASKYDGKDGRPKFDRTEVLEYAADNLIGNLEVAYKQMHEAELLDYAIKQAMGKTKGVKSEVSDGSGSSQIGTTQDDLKDAAAQGDEEALKTLIKRAL